MKIYLVAASNLEVLSYEILIEQGFSISKTGKLWMAKKDQITVVAEGQLELLGLATLVEKKGNNCKVSDDKTEEFLKLKGE